MKTASPEPIETPLPPAPGPRGPSTLWWLLTLLLPLGILFVACSQTSAAPTPPTPSQPVTVATGASSTIAAPDDFPTPASKAPLKSRPADPRTSAQLAQAACKGADGTWHCDGIKPLMAAGGGNGTAGNCGPTCTVPDWYFDFANNTGCASDANSGTSATCGGAGIGPLLTVAQAFARWGTRYPTFNAPSHVTTLHILSSQPAASATADPWGTFQPNTPDGMFAMIGTLAPVGAPFTIGAVTNISRGAAGTAFQVGITGGAAGEILEDTTVANQSYCVIESISVGVATCTSPMQGTGLTTPTNTTAASFAENGTSWTGASDTAQLLSYPGIFIDGLFPNVGTLSATGLAQTSGMTWLQGLQVLDPSSTPGTSTFKLRASGLLSMSLFSSIPQVVLNLQDDASIGGATPNPSCAQCWFPQAGTFSGAITWYGGAVGTTGNEPVFVGGYMFFRDDMIFHGSPIFIGVNNAVSLQFAGGTPSVYPNGSLILRSGGTAPAIWGASTLRVYQNAAAINRSGGTWANNVQVTTLQLTSAGLTTGTVPAVGGTFTNNGVTQVDTAATCAGGTTAPCFPIGAPITWSLATVGGTACLAGGPYFSAANTANNFFTKAVTANCNDVYNWVAGPTAGVTITSAAIDQYNAIYDAPSGARFTN